MIKPGIYPNQIPQEILSDKRRNAEILTFNQLKKLSDAFYIYYNCDWTDPEQNNFKCRDGEADFIVCHPLYGFITLEVKGGVVGRDGDSKDWFRMVRGNKEKIKNPVKQARDSKHVLLKFLNKNWDNSHKPYFNATHGVVLPNSGNPKGWEMLGADMPIDNFAFFEDMEGLDAKVTSMLLKSFTPDHGKLGVQGIKIIHQLFASNFNLEVSLKSSLDLYDKKIETFTDEQKLFLEITKAQTKCMISGGAGTGKTFLAIEKAKTLLQDKNVLFLSFNKGVANFVKNELKGYTNINIYTFFQFCHFSHNKYFQGKKEITDEVFDENKSLQKLIEALNDSKFKKYDALIVDEAQDFKPSWWDLILLSLENYEKNKIYIFSDDNQRIYNNKNKDYIKKTLKIEPLFLGKNVRNTQEIFNLTKVVYEGVTLKALGPSGPPILFTELKKDNQSQSLLTYVNKLINFEGVPKENIAILSLCNREKSIHSNVLLKTTSHSENAFLNKSLIFDSVWSFKGLERQVVILTDLENFIGNKELLYVAFSRARSLLHIFDKKEIIDAIKKELS